MKGTISFFYNNEIVHNALIPIPTKGTMPGSFKRVFNYIYFNPRTHEGYDEDINRYLEDAKALIPVPTEGTMIAASRSSTGM